MKSILLGVLVAYAGLCLLLFLSQRRFLYFPQSAGIIRGTAEIAFENDGEKLSGWVVNERNAKALLYYGGNAERIEENIAFFQRLLPDYTVYLIAYRGYGNSTGEPTEANLYNDALHIFDAVLENHSTIYLMGRSLGSGIATYVAANRPVEKLILVTPFDSIENVAKETYRIFPVSFLLKDKFESWRHARQISAKTLILRAENDEVISAARTEKLITSFEGDNLESILVKGAGHNDIQTYPEFSSRIKQLLNQ